MARLSLLPVPLALLGVLLVRPDLLTGALGSWRAWVASAVVVLVAFGVRRLVARSRPALAPWAGTAVTLGLLAALIAPSLAGQRTVVEDFPAVIEAADTTADLPAEPAADLPAAAGPSPTPAAPVAAPAPPAPAPAATSPARPSAATSAPTPAARASTAAPASAVRLSSGRLSGINHKASGGVAIYRVSGGNVLRFEDVSFNREPGPSVHLVPPGSRSPKGGVRLGKLKAEKGSFSYALPASVDATAAWSVLIWCDPYSTPIGASDLS